MNRLTSIFLAAVIAPVVMGCGTRAKVGDADLVNRTQISAVVVSLTDAVQDPAKFGKLWVTPPDAATAAKYKEYLYYSGGQPSLSGTTAKIKMKLEKPAGTVAGEPEWEFEKSGDTWKIKSAPLP